MKKYNTYNSNNLRKKEISIFILAAGMSSRLDSVTNDPKAILEINGKTMLGQTLKYILELTNRNGYNISQVIICVGFKKQKVIDYVNSLKLSNIHFLDNPLYSILNNNFSVWLARHLLYGKEFILINGDIFYEKEILIRSFLSNLENYSVIDTTKPLSEDSMKVLVSLETGKIRAFSKTFYGGDGCTVGIHKFSEKASVLFFDKLAEQLERDVKSFHHSAIDELIKDGFYDHFALDIKGLKWCEIDDPYDLEKAKEIIDEL